MANELKDVIVKLDTKYGAPMGRASSEPDETGWHQKYKGKLYLKEVPLDEGGYDAGGAYWGIGEQLYVAYSPRNEDVVRFWGPCLRAVQVFVQAKDRDAAKAEVLESVPNAVFYS
jgi:hypothetical protein